MNVTYGTRFPSYLSNQLQILWWELDEVAIILVFFTLVIISGGWVNFICLIVLPYLYGKAKRAATKGFFKHIIYFSGLGKLDGYPSFFEKKFVE